MRYRVLKFQVSLSPSVCAHRHGAVPSGAPGAHNRRISVRRRRKRRWHLMPAHSEHVWASDLPPRHDDFSVVCHHHFDIKPLDDCRRFDSNSEAVPCVAVFGGARGALHHNLVAIFCRCRRVIGCASVPMVHSQVHCRCRFGGQTELSKSICNVAMRQVQLGSMNPCDEILRVCAVRAGTQALDMHRRDRRSGVWLLSIDHELLAESRTGRVARPASPSTGLQTGRCWCPDTRRQWPCPRSKASPCRRSLRFRSRTAGCGMRTSRATRTCR